MSECPFANIMEPTYLGDGYAGDDVANIRAAGPAVKIDDPSTGVPYWAITQHSAIDFVSKNNDLFSSRLRTALPMEFDQAMVDDIQSQMFINLDPPDNIDYRKLIRDHFTPAAVATYEPRAREYARKVVDRMTGKTSCEFVTDVAAELPLLMILDFFDIPGEDRHKIFEWTNVMMFGDDPDVSGGREAADTASLELMLYAHQLAGRYRNSDVKNVSSQLLNGVINGEPVSDDTFGWIFLMIIVAGNESTRTTITHAVRNLIEHPEQYRYLQENPDKIEGAIFEMLRYNPPFICMRRTATQDITVPELDNAPIKKGDKIIMYYPGANRDPEVFTDPEAFDVHRADQQDLPRDIRSFGIGRHNCFGMNLAKMEMRVMLEEILSRMDNMQFNGPVVYMKSNFVQGIKEMPITFEMRDA
ncbi:cytochrome P450 [Halioglobus sp. Uisw_031]|jgi:cytochrome P450|uniref:cytochrome P450 n=1 Tax=Halioglobus sp. Uisw_031 TaxID=3230977 RepID=UPI0039E78023